MEEFEIISAKEARLRSVISQKEVIMNRIKKATKKGYVHIRYAFKNRDDDPDIEWLKKLGYSVFRCGHKIYFQISWAE